MAFETSATAPIRRVAILLNDSFFFGCTVGLTLFVSLYLTGCRRERLAPPVPPPPVVSVARPVTYPIQRYYEYNGNLDPVEMVQINARVQGILNEIAFKEGDEVAPNALLFRIDPREYSSAVKKAEADRRKASVEVKRTQTEEARAMKLSRSEAISQEDYEQRVAARETAEAVVLQAEAALESARLQLEYTEIRSPIAGQISRTMVSRGNLVGQEKTTMLTSIMSMDPLYIYFDAPERDLVEYQRTLRPGQEADLLGQSIPVEIGVATEEGFPHVGKIDFRENHVDVGTGTVRIRGRIPNPRVPPGNARLLYPGLYARVRIPAGEPQSLPAIPEDALMSGQEGHYVYVLTEGNIIQKRSVKLGPIVWKSLAVEDGQSMWTMVAASSVSPSPKHEKPEKPEKSRTVNVPSVVAIENGLTVNDRIVVNGLTKARPGTAVAPESWELQPPRESAGTK